MSKNVGINSLTNTKSNHQSQGALRRFGFALQTEQTGTSQDILID